MAAKEDLYDDGADAAPSPSRDEQTDVMESVVNKSFFGGHDCQVGDIKKIKVTGIHGDEATIAYVPSESKDDDEEMPSREAEVPAGMGGEAGEGMYD